MKIYEISRVEELNEWFLDLPYKFRFGYGSGHEIIYTPFGAAVGSNAIIEAQQPVTVPFRPFKATGWSEGEVCVKLALQIEEYLAERDGKPKTIHIRRQLAVDGIRDFDTDRRRWYASVSLLADHRLDEIEAERAKRAE